MTKLYTYLFIVSLALVTNSGYSQAGDTVLKLELTNIYQTNFLQLSYEFNINSNSSHEISLGTGKNSILIIILPVTNSDITLKMDLPEWELQPVFI